MKSLLENLFVDIVQISDHMFGKNQPSHLTRSCLICQPNGPVNVCSQQRQMLLPASFPCDKDFEMAKGNSTKQVAKRIVFLGNKQTRYAKELILFFTSLNYNVDNRPVATKNLVIVCLENDVPSYAILQENIDLANQVTCIVNPNYFVMDVNPNILYILITDISQIRQLHLTLLQRIGRATVAEVIDICTKYKIETICKNSALLQNSFVY